MIAECDGKYTTVGSKPNRGSPGIKDSSWPKKKLSISAQKTICNLMTRCEDVVAKEY
jgi:hypothetical protein